MASGSDSPATTISSDSPPEPQAEGTASSRLGPVENVNRPNVLKRTVKVLLPLPLADASITESPMRWTSPLAIS